MKAATGETTLTLITIVAIGALLVFFGLWWTNRQGEMNKEWQKPTDKIKPPTSVK